jgi:hypothetical protein
MRVGVGALERPSLVGLVDEDKRCARVSLAKGVHVFDLQSGFGDGVNEHEVELLTTLIPEVKLPKASRITEF